MTRYIVMVRRPNSRLMKIIANKASRAEAQEIATREGGVVKTVGKRKKRKK